MGRLFAAISVLALLGARGPGGFEPDPESAARYCYRSLGEVECYAQPLPGEATRKIGFFDRAALNTNRP